jgi:hypothetical protein
LQALYNSLPEGVVGAAGAGLIGRILLGSTPAGALISGIYLIGEQVKKLEGNLTALGIAGKEEWQAGMLKAAEDLQRAKGIMPSLKFYKVTPPPPESAPESTPTDDWMEQFRIKNELRLKMEGQFNADYSNLVFSRWDLERKKVKELQALYIEAGFEKTKIAEIINDKMKAISDEETENKRHQLEQEKEIEDERWALITEAYNERQRIFELGKEFDQEYAEMGKNRFDLERMQVDELIEKYKGLSDKKVQLAELTTAKLTAIALAEQQTKLAIYSNMAGQIAGTFQQIAQAGGKQSKEAFIAYKVFAMAQAGIAGHMAYLNTLASPLLIPPQNIIMANIVLGLAAVQMAMIAMAQPPSYDRGGISNAKGIYQTGNIAEAHIPLESGGTIPVRFDSKSEESKEQTPINIINVNDPSQLDTYLASSRGQDAILNVLSTRNQSVRRILR